MNQFQAKKSNLAEQSYEQLQNLDAKDQQIISRQATINIGTIGHAAHGKTTLVKAISGINTVRFQKEKFRNLTIKLGYANAKIFKCPNCQTPSCYQAFSSNQQESIICGNENCEEPLELIRHISFVDCPGHEILMATMLAGAAVMDAALLIIAANQQCPQPQTREHLAAIEIMNMDKIIIVQNKVDLASSETNQTFINYQDIKTFVQGTKAENSPIIPISAQLGLNIDTVLQYICEYIPIPKRNLTLSPKLMIIRSFDVNKPGISYDKLQGGVVGGSILQGILKIGDEIEIRPGLITKTINGNYKYTPIFSQIVSLFAEQNQLQYAIPGGLIGVGLKVDPSLTRGNGLSGQVLGLYSLLLLLLQGYPGKLPFIYRELNIQFYLLDRLLGVKTLSNYKIRKIMKNEILMVNIGSTQTGGKIIEINQNYLTIQLLISACISVGDKISLSRRIEKNWRLIGWGIATGGIHQIVD